MGTVVKTVPEPMKSHFELNMHLQGSNRDLKQQIPAHIKGQKVWQNPVAQGPGLDTGPKTMEIHAVTSGGYPKGRRKGDKARESWSKGGKQDESANEDEIARGPSTFA